MNIFIIFWLAVACCMFTFLIMDGPNDLGVTWTELIVIGAILFILWPAAIIISLIGLPAYWIHKLINRNDKPVKRAAVDEDDDEPQGFYYEEHEDDCDGNTEYEDDDEDEED